METAPLCARQQGLLMLVVLGSYFLNGMFHDVSAVPMANMFLFFLAGVTAGLLPWIKDAVEQYPAPSFAAARRIGPVIF